MLKLRKLIKEHTWDREFGDPLVTFEDVMEKHQKNKFKEDLDSVDKEDDDVDNDGDSDASDDYLKNRRDVISKAIEKESVTEGWWDNMNDASQAAYIKTHGGPPKSSGGGDDDYEMAPDMDSRDYDVDDDGTGDDGGGTGGGDNSERLGQISQEKATAEQEMAHAEEMGDKNAYADAEQKLYDLGQEEEGLGGSSEPDKKDDLG